MTAVTVQGQSVAITTGSATLAAIDTGLTMIGSPTDAIRGQPISEMPLPVPYVLDFSLVILIQGLWPVAWRSAFSLVRNHG
jgi:hypothetical protein